MLPDELLLRYHEGRASASEHSEVEVWLKAKPANQETYDDLVAIWTHSARAGRFAQIDTQAAWKKLNGQLEAKGISPPHQAKVRRFPTVRIGLAIAAALAFLFLIAGLWWQSQPSLPSYQMATHEQPGPPALVSLPDGSQVSLRKGSSLSYPEAFTGNSRTVELTGEAYFSVVSNPEQPFVVLTAESRTEVLGTEFSIRALPGDTLVLLQVAEGRVAFSSRKSPEGREVFQANEQGELDKSKGKLIRLDQPNRNAFGWQQQRLVFEGESLREVLEQLAGYHQVSLTFAPDARGLDCRLYTTWDQLSLTEALADLKDLFALTYLLEGDTLLITGAQSDCKSGQ